MKKTIYMMFGSMLLMSFFACGPTKEDAIKYNDAIITEQRKVVDKENELTGAIKSNAGNLDEILAGLTKQTEESIAVVTKMEDFDKKSDFKDAALKLFNVYKDVAAVEYKAWLANLKTPIDQVNDQVLAEETELVKKINEKIDKALGDFTKAQEDFAAKYKFEIAK
jgi:uncharacterized coiled-coil protein SlyX